MPEPAGVPVAFACRICGNPEGNRLWVAREMMFGTREPFEYVECVACGCLQIRTIPEDLSPYYPPEYYAYATFRQNPLKRLLYRTWARHHLEQPNLPGRLLTRAFGRAIFFDWAQRAGASFGSAILDVGSGQGKLLLRMAAAGFRDLTGVDPFIERDLSYPGGVRVLKRDVAGVEGAYDLVMSHHAFEHVPDPERMLSEMARLVRPGGTILIRIPVASSHAWEQYRTDWVALDPPRHLYLHTPASMQRLAGRAGLTVADVVYDSNAMQFWASEQYRRGIPLMGEHSYGTNPKASPFTREDIQAYARQAEQLNAEGRGDTAAFYLRKP